MSNEELTVRIQSGEDRMGELWEQVKGLAAWKANHIVTALDLRGNPRGVEFDDLYQSGYLALVAAVDTFDPAAGAAFSTWFMFHLQNAFAEATGYRTRRGRNEPINTAISLDRPLTDDADSSLFGDFIPDAKAAATMLSIEERLWRKQLCEAVEAVMGELPEQYREILDLRYLQGMTLAAVGELKGVTAERIRIVENKAIREVRKARYACRLRPFYDFDFYCGTGLGAFQHTGMSIQERYLVAEEEAQERAEQRRRDRENKRRQDRIQNAVSETMASIYQEAEDRVSRMTPEEKLALLAKYGYA